MSVSALVQDLFPFKAYFADAPGPLFKGDSLEEDMEAAKGCWRHLRTMFQELEECRAFELLKVYLRLSAASLLCLLRQEFKECSATGLLSVGPRCQCRIHTGAVYALHVHHRLDIYCHLHAFVGVQLQSPPCRRQRLLSLNLPAPAEPGGSCELSDDQAGQDCGHDLHPRSSQAP